MEKNPSRPFQVVLDIAATTHVMRGVFRGILRFARDARDWVLVATQPGLLETLPPGTAFDGAVVQGRDSLRRLGKVLRGRKAVELNLDARSVARLAAGHFLERGFAHFAFVDHENDPRWSTDRREAFRRELAARGFACAVYRPPSGGPADDLSFRHRHLGAWLATRPRPLAVLAAFDDRARDVLAACRVAGLGVPEDVAVLGVDNDPLWCEWHFRLFIY